MGIEIHPNISALVTLMRPGLDQGAPRWLFHSNDLFLALNTMRKEEEFGSEWSGNYGKMGSWGGLALNGLHMVGKGERFGLEWSRNYGKRERVCTYLRKFLTAGKETDWAPSIPSHI